MSTAAKKGSFSNYRRGSTSERSGARGSLSGKRPSLAGFSSFRGLTPAKVDKDLSAHLEELEELFTLTPQRLRMIRDAFVDAVQLGLEKPDQTIANYPAWVFSRPTGQEMGTYLAVDLGGSNLRVAQVQLHGDGTFKVTQTKYRITEQQKREEGQKLLDFCAECLGSFLLDQYGTPVEEGSEPVMPIFEEPLALGFTFSYPCYQKSIDHGVLKSWTKGWASPGVEGKDVAEMFRTSLRKYDLPVNLVALVNDTTGCLIASAYVDPRTKIGVIFGTGCNAAYIEDVANIPKLKDSGLPDDAQVAINCEWGAFDNEREALPRTKFDDRIDEQSPKPREQAFEKMISGLYLGEVFRQAVLSIIEGNALFDGQDTFKFEKSYSFETQFLSMMEADDTEPLLTIAGIFSHFFGLSTTVEERKALKRIAQLVGTRSARLSACGIAALVTLKNYTAEECGVATDGSLFAFYPGFADRLSEALVDIFGEDGHRISIYASEDGSGVGAAVISALTDARRKAGLYPDY